MTVTIPARYGDPLNRAQQRVRDLRQRRADITRAIERARESEDIDTAEAVASELPQVAAELERAEDAQAALLRSAAGVGNNPLSPGCFEDPSVVRTLEAAAHSTSPLGSVNLGPLMSRDEFIERVNSGSWGQPKLAVTGQIQDVPSDQRTYPAGITTALRRKLSILDLIPAQPVDYGQSFAYMQEVGGSSYDTGVAETAEGTTKPAGALTWVDAVVTAQTIAVYLKVLRQQLDDVAGLGTLIQDRLSYSVMRRLENEVLSGNGTGANLKGILNTSGVGVVTFTSGDLIADQIHAGIEACQLSAAEPDAVVMHPSDVGTALKAVASGSGERLDSAGAFAPVPDTVWGLPIIANVAIPQGTALVGQFGAGAALFVREAANIKMSDSDQDDFVNNRITVLGEGRFGLAVWRPAAFCKVALA